MKTVKDLYDIVGKKMANEASKAVLEEIFRSNIVNGDVLRCSIKKYYN